MEKIEQSLKPIHAREQYKLMDFLQAFYQHHPLIYDRHLTIIHVRGGQCLLRSQGADLQDVRQLEERTQKLREYQQEMLDFAAFLKEHSIRA